jgi:predicted transcriptional regulator
MHARNSLELKKKILFILSDGKEHTFAELERKVNSNWQTIRSHCRELEIFRCVKIEYKKNHSKNNKPYYVITINQQGFEALSRM